MSKLLFESQTCGRCGGSGSYSYCSMHGSRCFGCGGLGEKLTKRGAAAQAFYRASASKPAGEFVPGDLIQLIGVTMGGGTYTAFERVTSVTIDGDKCVIESERKGQKASLHTSVSAMYRRGLTAEEKQDLVAKAKAYQETLTKLGKPRKEKS